MTGDAVIGVIHKGTSELAEVTVQVDKYPVLISGDDTVVNKFELQVSVACSIF